MTNDDKSIRAAADRIYGMMEEIQREAYRPSDATACYPSSHPRTDSVVASIIPPYLRTCHTTRKIAGHAENLEEQLNQAMAALRILYEAADVYAADQSVATDERCGLVHPITADDGRALNEALVVAAKILENHQTSGGPSAASSSSPD